MVPLLAVGSAVYSGVGRNPWRALSDEAALPEQEQTRATRNGLLQGYCEGLVIKGRPKHAGLNASKSPSDRQLREVSARPSPRQLQRRTRSSVALRRGQELQKLNPASLRIEVGALPDRHQSFAHSVLQRLQLLVRKVGEQPFRIGAPRGG